MEASNGAGLAVATSAKDDLRQQSMLRNGSASRATIRGAGHPPLSGIASNILGRGVPPERAAAAFSPAPDRRARASRAKDDLRQQPKLASASACRGMVRVAGFPAVAGTDEPTSGRGALPRNAAAGVFHLLPVVAPRDLPHAPEWNDRVARYMAA